MQAKVIKSMPEFGFYQGQVVNVTPGQFKKFMEKYQCFEDSKENKLISVRVRTNMHRKYGWDGWFPNTLQLGTVGELQKYIDSGELEYANSPREQYEKHVEIGNPPPDKPRIWTFIEDYGEYKKGQKVNMMVIDMQVGNKIKHAVNWDLDDHEIEKERNRRNM
jgi:hypothetical protein